MREGSPSLQRKKKKVQINLGNFILPCIHTILHIYTLQHTITGKINAKFKEIFGKKKQIPLFLKSTILHCGLRCSYSLSHLKSSQSVFLLHQLPPPLVHQSSKNSSPLLSCGISSSPKRFHRQRAGSYLPLSAGDF